MCFQKSAEAVSGDTRICQIIMQVSFKSGMEERGSDGWCDGGDI